MTSRAVKSYIRRALEAGQIADCRQFPEKDREVDAGYLRALALGGLPAGMRVVGLTITGTLDLRDCGSAGNPLPALRIEQCRIVSPLTGDAPDTVSIDLSRSHVASLSLQGSRLLRRGRSIRCRPGERGRALLDRHVQCCYRRKRRSGRRLFAIGNDRACRSR
mgnify:CR=1 FL=1